MALVKIIFDAARLKTEGWHQIDTERMQNRIATRFIGQILS